MRFFGYRCSWTHAPERERSGGSGDGQERFALFGPKRLHEPVRRRELQRG